MQRHAARVLKPPRVNCELLRSSVAVRQAPTSLRGRAPGSMSVVEVREAPSCGRGMFVTQDVPSGADVVSEPPLLLTVARDAAQHYCGQCLRVLPQPGASTAS